MIWIFWSNRSEFMCCNREEQNTIILIKKKLTRKPVKWLRTRILVGISYKTGSGNHHVGRMTKPRFYSSWILAGCQLKKAMQAGRQASQKSTSLNILNWGLITIYKSQPASQPERAKLKIPFGFNGHHKDSPCCGRIGTHYTIILQIFPTP